MICEKCKSEYVDWHKRKRSTNKKLCLKCAKGTLVREEIWKLENGNYKCPYCNKEYTKTAICSHIWASHTKDGKAHIKKTLDINHKNCIGHSAWNKGLKKETSDIISKSVETLKKNIAVGKYVPKGHPHTPETKIKCSISGRKSASAQSRRSKNEILFCSLCESYFKDVKNNIPIFNGWDADVIIEDLKIAVLWNGIWHYKKVNAKHSLLQVQTRDKFKIKQIIKCGYTPYIIKDVGKHNINFVKEEFDKFIKSLETNRE